MDNDNYLRVGVVVKTHGLRGELTVFPTTDDPTRFKKLKECLIFVNGEEYKLHPGSVRYFKQCVIISFKEYDNINDVTKFVKKDIMITRDNAIKLEPGEYFICDLIGQKIVTYDGEELGILEDVMTNAANNVYVVRMNNGKELLIPVIDDSNISHDLESGITKVTLLKGLL